MSGSACSKAISSHYYIYMCAHLYSCKTEALHTQCSHSTSACPRSFLHERWRLFPSTTTNLINSDNLSHQNAPIWWKMTPDSIHIHQSREWWQVTPSTSTNLMNGDKLIPSTCTNLTDGDNLSHPHLQISWKVTTYQRPPISWTVTTCPTHIHQSQEWRQLIPIISTKPILWTVTGYRIHNHQSHEWWQPAPPTSINLMNGDNLSHPDLPISWMVTFWQLIPSTSTNLMNGDTKSSNLVNGKVWTQQQSLDKLTFSRLIPRSLRWRISPNNWTQFSLIPWYLRKQLHLSTGHTFFLSSHRLCDNWLHRSTGRIVLLSSHDKRPTLPINRTQCSSLIPWSLGQMTDSTYQQDTSFFSHPMVFFSKPNCDNPLHLWTVLTTVNFFPSHLSFTTFRKLSLDTFSTPLMHSPLSLSLSLPLPLFTEACLAWNWVPSVLNAWSCAHTLHSPLALIQQALWNTNGEVRWNRNDDVRSKRNDNVRLIDWLID